MESSSAYESARLILRLYELRREPEMREAHDWFLASFHPGSADEIVAVLESENNERYRMVVGYWDMAASFVNHGAIELQMFLDACLESISAFSRIEHLLADLRVAIDSPRYLVHWERVMRSIPNSSEVFAHFRT